MEAINPVNQRPVNGPVKVTSTNILSTDSNQSNGEGNKIARLENELKANIKDVKEETSSKIERIAEAMDQYVRSVQRGLKIQVHSATGNIMVKVISEEDGRVIREIPPKELLDLAAKMEKMTGTIFNESA